jgi:hypothetical protein
VLKTSERWILFAIFCVIVLGAAYQEYALSLQGFSIVNTVWVLVIGVVLGGALAGSSKLFLKIISKNFLNLGITPSRLHKFSSARSRIVADAAHSGEDEYLTRARLVTNTLRYSEDWLRGWVPGSHFELSVFVDREMPLLFAYFDSNQDETSRSMKDRERNPRFYIENRYEVTRLLQAPTSQLHILKDTTKTGYAFTSNHQRDQLRSTILMCPDVAAPCALVITSNKKNAFREKDEEVISLIQYIAETVYSDLVERDFLAQIRSFRPDLFPFPRGHAY